jgi:DNA-binding HxlR family transcriptional regulator
MSQRQPPPVEAGPYRSHCAIARTLDLLGDKWTLLVLRDSLFFDVSTFAGFCQRPEQVPTNLLAARLKKLVAAGLMEKVAYQQRPTRYQYLPTAVAKELIPALLALKQFGDNYLQD